MAIRVVVMLGIILVLAGLITVCVIGFSKRKKVMQIVGAVGTVAGLLAFIAVPFSIYTVDTGEVAVVKLRERILISGSQRPIRNMIPKHRRYLLRRQRIHLMHRRWTYR